MFWLTFWTEDEFLRNTSNVVYEEYEQKTMYYLLCYTVMGVIQGCPFFQ